MLSLRDTLPIYKVEGVHQGAHVIELTRFSGERFVLNADLIEMVEATPDTLIRLLNGKRLVVRETVEQVVLLALEYARRVHCIDVPEPEEMPPTAPV
jgi:flagellar protein FlbD